jgi:hypothetical protein
LFRRLAVNKELFLNSNVSVLNGIFVLLQLSIHRKKYVLASISFFISILLSHECLAIQVSIYKTTCTNPYWNLAFEEWLLRNFDCSNPANKTLFLWQNNSTVQDLFFWQFCLSATRTDEYFFKLEQVVMGRHQNPWKECNLNLLWSLNGHLTRRESGGGCVYHVSPLPSS